MAVNTSCGSRQSALKNKNCCSDFILVGSWLVCLYFGSLLVSFDGRIDGKKISLFGTRMDRSSSRSHSPSPLPSPSSPSARDAEAENVDSINLAEPGAEPLSVLREPLQDGEEMDIDQVVLPRKIEEKPLPQSFATSETGAVSDPTSATVFIQNLPKKGVLPRTIRRALLERFERWRLPIKRSVKLTLSARIKGCAFVICRSRDAAIQAIDSVRKSKKRVVICGNAIRVSLSHQKSEFTRRRDQDDQPGSIIKSYNARKAARRHHSAIRHPVKRTTPASPRTGSTL